MRKHKKLFLRLCGTERSSYYYIIFFILKDIFSVSKEIYPS